MLASNTNMGKHRQICISTLSLLFGRKRDWKLRPLSIQERSKALRQIRTPPARPWYAKRALSAFLPARRLPALALACCIWLQTVGRGGHHCYRVSPETLSELSQDGNRGGGLHSRWGQMCQAADTRTVRVGQ